VRSEQDSSIQHIAPHAASRDPRVSVVVPLFNEAHRLGDYGKQLADFVVELPPGSELLFVDDGSTDGTLAVLQRCAARDPRVRYISFTRNYGLEAAFGAGFRYAARPWIAQLDADLQSPPSEIHRLLSRAIEGDYDVVFGTRPDRQDSWFRRSASRVQHWIARRVLGIEVPVGASTFRVIRTPVAKKITSLRLGTPYFLASVPLVGARYTTVPTRHQLRRNGRSRFRFGRLVSHTADLFFGFSARPYAAVPALAALGGLVTVAFTLAAALGAVPLWGGVVGLLGLQVLTLAGLAVVGRYVIGIGRQAHPLRYLVRTANVPIDPGDLLDESTATNALTVTGRPA
jgi:glycosyltransferase involved in cell wall biosynthesis